MFTGIIEEIGKVTLVQSRKLIISANKITQGLEIGGSVAVNGVCLTVTSFNKTSFYVDVMPETLERTNLRLVSSGDEVNLERPLTLQKPLGGHLVQGHVDATGRIVAIERDGDAMLVKLEASPSIIRYIVEKGFIAVDGISLTIVYKDADTFQVSIVGFTQQHTIISRWRLGTVVNLEIDIIAKYVEQFNQFHNGGITLEFLKEHGY
ncbi:MAG: riboflavin synthase [Dehalococcoidales bacterium]|nr:riboflavin synthase [Dehalococcoidales bacterium]